MLRFWKDWKSYNCPEHKREIRRKYDKNKKYFRNVNFFN